jgi:multidrug efflux pump subunit AcrA (membrane-fusion protein)
VTEGQAVKEGDPIVTLVDSDPELIQRLGNQLAAANQQMAAIQQATTTEEQNLKRQQRLQEQGLKSQRDIETAQLDIQKLRAEAAKIEAEINRLGVEKARQSLQTKVAPSDGTILRLKPSGNATYVTPGDVLASFIPEGKARSVVLAVSGLDAPLVYPGRPRTTHGPSQNMLGSAAA